MIKNFAIVLGAANYNTIRVPVFTEIEKVEETALWKEFTESQSFDFIQVTEDEAKNGQ